MPLQTLVPRFMHTKVGMMLSLGRQEMQNIIYTHLNGYIAEKFFTKET